MVCGVTNTIFANKMAPTIMNEYGGQLKGGCPCMAGAEQAQPKPRKNGGLIGGGGGADGMGTDGMGCTGGTPMLKALGIMQGGRRQQRGGFAGNCTTCKVYRGGKRRGTKRNNCRCKPGAYKATPADKARLNRHLSGKSIGFTQRSSLKAKGLLRRANGTCKVSRKYQ